jgi:hypothetical protein
MRDWNDSEQRREATRIVVKHLNENAGDRDKCKNDRAYAKELYARIGEVEKIPEGTEFRMYEHLEIKQRDEELAIFVLSDPHDPIDVTKIYRCTWDPWGSARNRTGS